MRIAIVGSREFPNLKRVVEFVDNLIPGTVVVSGGARGVDATAAKAARARGLQVIEHLADWNKHGKKAGILRNQTIVNSADEVFAFWDGQSRGTKDTLNKAKAAGKPVRIFLP